MLNNCTLMGRLTKDPELRYTTTNKAVVSFRLAVNRDIGDGADFINCVAWNKTAEFVDQWFTKGMLMALMGRVQTRDYESNGQKRSVTEVVADHVWFAESKREEKPRKAEKPRKTDFVPIYVEDEDLPF